MWLAGIGTAVPEYTIFQADAAEMASSLLATANKKKRVVAELYRRSGVDSRHFVLLKSSTQELPLDPGPYQRQDSPTDRGPTTAARMEAYEANVLGLATPAAEKALEHADVSPDCITHLVTATCSGFSAPGYDLGLVANLPLSREVQRTQVGFMGCHGAMNALRVANAFVAADPQAVVLVSATELCSVHYQYGSDRQAIVSNALFADGSAAVVARATPPHTVRNPWSITAHGSVVLPDTVDLMSWRIGDHGFEMILSPRVPEAIQKHLAPWLDRWLGKQGLQRSDIRSWAIHPGGSRILLKCADALGLTPTQIELSRGILREYGNMSSPTILFIVEELQRREAPLPAAMLAFGPGLTIEAALVV